MMRSLTEKMKRIRKPARRGIALLAGFALLCGPGLAEEQEIDLGDLFELEEEEVAIRDPADTLLAKDIEWHTPGEGSPVQCDHENCYWKLPMGSHDEAAVWRVLTAPVTVLDFSQRHQYKARKEPSADCTEYTGEITGESQAVHVLERGEEWTLVEAYSSSPEGSKVKVWAEKFQGWVETKLLKEVPVDQTYGIVIDKQKQRLYLYKEGKLYSTLLCSTGYYNPKKGTRWNETPAGEFLCISWTGDFPLKDDDGNVNMMCNNAIRINDGILIHEVPMIPKDDGNGGVKWSYDRCERYLGEKASHGCIRVQQKRTPEGINEKWLWDNLSNGNKAGQLYTKVIIWDDAGRTLGYPDEELKLYWDSKNYSAYYHSSPECERIRGSKHVVEFTYGELEDSKYRSKKACPCCAPEPRRAGIEEMNEKNNR